MTKSNKPFDHNWQLTAPYECGMQYEGNTIILCDRCNGYLITKSQVGTITFVQLPGSQPTPMTYQEKQNDQTK